MLGAAPIIDFDGTLARLQVPWAALRAQLGVNRLDDLWGADPSGWAPIAEAEVAAAEVAIPIAGMLAQLEQSRGFAVLTNNSEAAVRAFLGRHPWLAERCAAIAGRESLGGPKQDPRHFLRGFELCAAATASFRGDEGIVYVGDLPWELSFARNLGAIAIDVVEVERTAREPGD